MAAMTQMPRCSSRKRTAFAWAIPTRAQDRNAALILCHGWPDWRFSVAAPIKGIDEAGIGYRAGSQRG